MNRLLAAVLAVALASALGAQAPAAARLEVRVEGAATRTFTAADLARLPRAEARVEDHGRPAHFAGVWLADVLQLAGVPIDSVRGRRAGLVVVAAAADGYRAAFSLAELAPDLGARAVLLADTRDGAPLGADEGPLRLVVPDDRRATRWVRQLATLTVRPAAP